METSPEGFVEETQLQGRNQKYHFASMCTIAFYQFNPPQKVLGNLIPIRHHVLHPFPPGLLHIIHTQLSIPLPIDSLNI